MLKLLRDKDGNVVKKELTKDCPIQERPYKTKDEPEQEMLRILRGDDPKSDSRGE